MLADTAQGACLTLHHNVQQTMAAAGATRLQKAGKMLPDNGFTNQSCKALNYGGQIRQ